jgi:serine/threonine-protein kinase
MPDPVPGNVVADRNLLFGILAVQMDFIRGEQLIAAMNDWVLAKGVPLSELLQQQGALAPEHRQLLDQLVAAHIRAHGDDLRCSLAAVTVPPTVHRELESVADSGLQGSLSATLERPLGTVDLQCPPAVQGIRYAVLRPHARGGLGVVSVARDAELSREVALKEIQAGHAEDVANRRRFVREAEITGALEHPGIVPVYGLGSYPDGRPYYAMRLIRGETLLEAAKKLHAGKPGYTLRGLLTRFVVVCNTVAYAHSRGVIHRDLKPANVMLGAYGETLVVDWGLAKVIGRSADRTLDELSSEGTLPVADSDDLATRAGTLLGTPAYMSPEQADGRLDLQGPATDVYGLGATLYALLTGRGPVEGCDTLDALDRARRCDWPTPRQVNSSVSEALDAICRRAMALRPSERYASAIDMAADVEHWLADEPVSVCRERASARLWRWARRHRSLVTGTAASLVAGVITLGSAAVLLAAANGRERAAAQMAERQRDRANENFKLAREAVDRFHTDVSQSAEMKARGVERLRTNLLQEAARFYERFLQDEGEGSAEVRAETGRALRRLASLLDEIGKTTEAEQRYRQSESVCRQLVSADSTTPAYGHDLADTLSELGVLYTRLARREESEAVLKEALDLRRHLAGSPESTPEQRADLAGTLNNLGNLYSEWGRYDLADAAYRECIEVGRRLATSNPDRIELQATRAKSLHNLGLMYRKTQRWKDAESACTEAHTLFRRLASANADVSDYRSGLANTSWMLGFLCSASGRRSEAEAAYSDAVTTYRNLVETHPALTEYQVHLAGSLVDQADSFAESGKTAEALAIYDEVGRRTDGLLGAEPRLAAAWLFLSRSRAGSAKTLTRSGRLAEAVMAWDRAAETYRRAADLAKGEQRSWLQAQQIDALDRAGRPLEAAIAADSIASKAVEADELYDAACLLSLVSPAVLHSAALPPLTATPLSQHYAAAAVSTLRRAVTAGFKDVAQVKKDADFAPVRSRADFKAVVSGMEAAVK